MIIGQVGEEQDNGPTKQMHALNCAFDHASHAPQLGNAIITCVHVYILCIMQTQLQNIIIILKLHLFVCVRESGRSAEAIRPQLKTRSQLGATSGNPLTLQAMALALDKSKVFYKIWNGNEIIKQTYTCRPGKSARARFWD